MARTRSRQATIAIARPYSEAEAPRLSRSAVPLFQVIHSLPTRIRIHIPDWESFEKSVLEHRLRLVPGVCAVRANPLTRNVLIQFEPPPGGKDRVLKLIDAVLRKCAAQADHPGSSAGVATTVSTVAIG